jgi:hypothetical protein
MVEIRYQGYECLKCGRFPTARVPELDVKRGATQRLVEYVAHQALTRRFSDIADETGLHNTSVREYFLERVERWDEEATGDDINPKYVWLHRVKNVRRHCVVADLLTQKPIGLISSDDRIERSFEPSFTSQIDSFATDVSDSYRSILVRMAPRAVIFVPRSALLTFSMVQMRPLLLWASRTVTRSQYRNLQKLIDLGRKPQRLIFMHQRLQTFAKSSTGRAETACNLYLGFLEILSATSASRAEELFYNWVQSIPPPCESHLSEFVETLNSWKKEIFNTTAFETITADQGLALALHVRAIVKEGRGYDYEVLRGKLVYGPTPSVEGK